MLHPMFVRFADVKDLNAVRRGGGDSIYHLLHLRIRRVKIADVIPQYALRPRHIRTVLTAIVEIEFLFLLSKNDMPEREAKCDRYKQNVRLHIGCLNEYRFEELLAVYSKAKAFLAEIDMSSSVECPRCGSPKLKPWSELTADEKFLAERLPASADYTIEERTKHRICTRCWFEQVTPKSDQA
jgi:hypothetical protein